MYTMFFKIITSSGISIKITSSPHKAMGFIYTPRYMMYAMKSRGTCKIMGIKFINMHIFVVSVKSKLTMLPAAAFDLL